MLLLKGLKVFGFNFNSLPVDLKKSVDLISDFTKGTFETDNQKMNVLDSKVFDAIEFLYPDDEDVQNVSMQRAFDLLEINNDDFNTETSEEVDNDY